MEKGIQKKVMSEVLVNVRTTIKARILQVISEEFRRIAVDYVSIRNAGTGDNISVDDIMSLFIEIMGQSFDSNLVLGASGVSIGIGDEDLLGFNSTEFSQVYELNDFRWVSFYINGVRDRYIHLNYNILNSGIIDYLLKKNKIDLEEYNYFKERMFFYKTDSSELNSLVNNGKVVKFSGSVLLEPDLFFDEGWNLIFPPEYVSLNIESNTSFIPSVLSRIEQERIIETSLQSLFDKVSI